MEEFKIGTVTLAYDENGKITTAKFVPDMVVNLDPDLLYQLKADNSTEALQSNADLILGAWFQRSNDVELADREQWEVGSTLVDCQKYPNGKVQKCVLDYHFKRRI